MLCSRVPSGDRADLDAMRTTGQPCTQPLPVQKQKLRIHNISNINATKLTVKIIRVFLHTFILFRANDTGQLSSCDVDWTWQCSTLDFNRVDPCLVLVYSANCDFRCLVPTHVAGALMGACASSISCSQISSVLDGPAIRTLCSCWNHGNGWSTLHVAEGTRRWFII